MPRSSHAAERALSDDSEQQRNDRQRTVGPAPEAQFCEHAAKRRPEQRPQAPHGRHDAGCPRPMAFGKCCTNYRIAESCQQTAAKSLHDATDDQRFHRWAGGIGRCAESEDDERRNIGKRRPLPVENAADEQRGYDCRDNERSRHPRIILLPANIRDDGGHQCGGEIEVHGIEQHAACHDQNNGEVAAGQKIGPSVQMRRRRICGIGRTGRGW